MSKTLRYAFTYCIPIIMVVYYLIMRGINLNSVIMLPIYFFLTIKAVEILLKNNHSTFIKMMNVFLGYSLASIVLFAVNNVPVSCFFATLRTFFFPFVFAYLGYNYSSDHEFNKWYLYGCAFCFVVGIYLYIVGPGYYTAYLASVRDSGALYNPVINETNILDFTRFSSFFPTPYAVSCFSIPTLIISLAFSSKRETGVPQWACYSIAVISFTAAFLCQQRIAIAFAIAIVIFYGFYLMKLNRGGQKFGVIIAYILIALLIVSVMGSIAHFEWYDRIFTLVERRFELMDFEDAMSHRTNQYNIERSSDLFFIFGSGMGSCGHAAIFAGYKGVADGEFVKTFYEYGVVGCFILGSIILSSLYRGLRFFKLYNVEVLIMVFYLAAGIASNSLTFFIYSIMFWYSMGRIWNKKYYERLKRENV